jgi:fluoroquinolone transport system permease protein
MNAFRAVSVLAPIDARNILRDSLLRWMILFPVIIAVALRLGYAFLVERVQLLFGMDLLVYQPLIFSFLVIMLPMLLGAVLGFLLLDQRDDHTLTALQLTPLALKGYLTYRLSIPMLLNIFISMAVLPLTGLLELKLGLLILAVVAAAPLTPIYALTLAGFADNKVQGFAFMKAAGVTLLPPLFAYFVQGNWQWLFGLMPTYWPARVYWSLIEGDFATAAFALVVGLVFQLAVIALLIRRVTRRLHE